jgi:hypothetical protein
MKKIFLLFTAILLLAACVPQAALIGEGGVQYQSGTLQIDEKTVVNWRVDDFGKIITLETITSSESGASITTPSTGCGSSHLLAADCGVASGVTLYTKINAAGGVDVHFEKDGVEFTP